LPVFDGGILALDETAEVKKEDVRNKGIVVRNKNTKLMWQFQFNNYTIPDTESWPQLTFN
jgi:hypothetical protein